VWIQGAPTRLGHRARHLVPRDRDSDDPRVEDGAGEDLRQRSDRQLREVEAREARGNLAPEQRIRQPSPLTWRLSGGEAPHEQRQRCAEDERAGGVDPVNGRVATDGDEGGHHLTGQAREHGQREPRGHREASSQVVVEGSQQQRRDGQPDGEQERRPRFGAEVAQGLLAQEIEAGQGGGGEQRRPNGDDSRHARVLERLTHPPSVRRERPRRIAGPEALGRPRSLTARPTLPT
jgi:hypothetical protein